MVVEDGGGWDRDNFSLGGVTEWKLQKPELSYKRVIWKKRKTGYRF